MRHYDAYSTFDTLWLGADPAAGRRVRDSNAFARATLDNVA